MVDFLEDFEEFKAELKNKWLEYYQTNLSFFSERNINIKQVKASNGGNRPYDDVILSIIVQLEKQAKDYLNFMFMMTSDKSRIIKVLDLDFDPDMELEKIREEKEKESKQNLQYNSPLDDFRKLNNPS